MTEPTPFLPPEISSFWETSIAITPSGTQEVLPTPAGRKYSTALSPLTSFPSMILTRPPFSIAPLAVAPLLPSPLLPPLLLFLAPGRCFRTWVLTTCQLFYLSLSPWFFVPTSVLLPLTFIKLAGMTLSPTLTLTVLLQRNTHLFPLLLLFLPLWHWMRPNLSFLSAASNAIIKPGSLLRWKVRLVKDTRLSLPLTEVMKIARLTSPLLDAPRQSSPNSRLRHGRRLALLFHPNQTQKLYTLFSTLSQAFLPPFPSLLISLTVLLPGNRLRSTPLTWDLTFPFLSQRPYVAQPEATSLSSTVPRAEGVSLVLLLFFLLHWPSCSCLQSFPLHCHCPRQSCPSNAKAPSSLWHGFSSSHLQSFLVFTFLSFHLENIFYYSHT